MSIDKINSFGDNKCKSFETHIEEFMTSLKSRNYKIVEVKSKNESEAIEYLKSNNYSTVVKFPGTNLYLCTDMELIPNYLNDAQVLCDYSPSDSTGELIENDCAIESNLDNRMYLVAKYSTKEFYTELNKFISVNTMDLVTSYSTSEITFRFSNNSCGEYMSFDTFIRALSSFLPAKRCIELNRILEEYCNY